MPFQVEINKKEEGVFTVGLWGPLDTTTYTLFEKDLEPILVPSTKAIILNMHGVNYISSLGIGSIFKVRKFLKDNNGTLLLTDLQPQIQRVFETVKALPEAIFTSIEEADAYLNEIQRRGPRAP